jgi:hypothetical protein
LSDPHDATEDIMELDPSVIGLQPVEDELHYPSQFDNKTEENSDSETMNLQNYDIPSFMRKKRLKR